MVKRLMVKGTLTFVGIMSVSTVVGYLFKVLGFPETNIVIVYLLAIQVMAWINENFIMGILSSIGATLTFNYFFTEPYLTLSVHDPSYIITFIIMTFSSILTSTLTSQVKRNAALAKAREKETAVLYNLTNQLTDAMDSKSISEIVTRNLSSFLTRGVGLVVCNESGVLQHHFIYQEGATKVNREIEDFDNFYESIRSLRSPYYASETFMDYPINGRTELLGVLRIPIIPGNVLDQKQQVLIHSFIESTALALERIRITEQRSIDREVANQERFRSTLLRSISHDLRTPLASILGNTEVLIQMAKVTDSEVFKNTLEGIHDEANWLYHMVENILSFTKLQEGKLAARKQLELVEEVVGSVIERFSKNTSTRNIEVKVPEEPLYVPMDAKLIEQVLINILDNAHKHTEEKDTIQLNIYLDESKNEMVCSIRNDGSSIAKSDLPHLFELFYSAQKQGVKGKNNFGLGLPICQAIIHAHGGTIQLHNLEDEKGVEVLFTLPMEVEIDE
ncbi:MAG: DUF4118 domain-containing protein [Firmicutes bacterium]|nr:DUF4118 domain-containing protein [Bacillota bacterium]